MAGSLFITAEISPKPEFYKDAKAAIRNIILATQKEDGCISFELFENLDKNRLFLIEEWKSEEDLAAHYQKDYTKSVFENYENWLSAPVRVVKLGRVA